MPKAKVKTSPTGNLLTGLVLVFPLLLFYELGVLFSNVMNGADFVTQTLISLVGIKGFIWVQIGLLAFYLALTFYMTRRQKFNVRLFIPVLLESCLYAVTMGTLIVFVMVDLLGIDPRLAVTEIKKSGLWDRLVLSVGAGVHEEFIFRLILFGGLSLLIQKGLKLRSWIATLLALAISSVLFSAAHHVGPLGEALNLNVFVYRILAGVFFGFLYQYRGFAIAVYTHALYDIYVLMFL